MIKNYIIFNIYVPIGSKNILQSDYGSDVMISKSTEKILKKIQFVYPKKYMKKKLKFIKKKFNKLNNF